MSTPANDHGDALARIRGSLMPARANARTVAAFTDNPGCTRRRVIDAARVKAYELADRLGYGATRGQSPFAITTGNRFERRLKDGSGYALLADVLRSFVDLPLDGLRLADVGRVRGYPLGDAMLEARARETDRVLSQIARGDANAPHIVDHPVLVFDVAGTRAFLEPDALAFRSGAKLELVEIKSYAIIDDQADPAKLAATSGQVGVYYLALRATLVRLGFSPDLLLPSYILVTPKNFGRTPVGYRLPLRKKTTALERVLRAVPRTADVLAKIPATMTLDVDPGERMDPGRRRDALTDAVKALPMLYVPECLASCDMARFCRHEAVISDDPSRLGRAARDNLAGLHRLADALRLANKGPGRGEEKLADVAAALGLAAKALSRARTAAGMDEDPAPRSARSRARGRA